MLISMKALYFFLLKSLVCVQAIISDGPIHYLHCLNTLIIFFYS